MRNRFELVKEKWKIGSIDYQSQEFPMELKRINNCPKLLYYRGRWSPEIFDKVAAVVGSRKITRYGKEIVERLTASLVEAGVTVVSGFMYGTDTEAHTQTLEFGGKTVAVLGNGLDYLYPTENGILYEKMLENGGLILSEYEANFKATVWSFPQRNRIVSGLTNRGVFVTEASLKSGSLITARCGLVQSKEVWALPGMITASTSQGTNWLIAEGKAKMLTDIGEAVNGNKSSETQLELFEKMSTDERKIIESLKTEDMTIDELARALKMPVVQVTVWLNQLSLREVVSEASGRFFVCVRR